MALIMTKCSCNYSFEHYYKHTFLEQKDKEKEAEKRPRNPTAFTPSDSQDT